MPQPQSISLSVQVQVPGGPSVSLTTDMETEAYDSIKVTIPAAADKKKVEIQPGGGTQVKFLMIYSDTYSDQIVFRVNAAGNPAHKLDKPVILSGEGSVGLLDSAPKNLFISNPLADDIVVEALVGRAAT